IHRAILGSFERFIAILIEHYAGEFPLFIAPTQVCLIPITQAHTTYALALRQRIVRNSSAYVEVFDKNETLAKRIRTAEKQHIPLIVVIGDKEIEDKILSVRDRSTREQYSLSEEEFIQMLQTKLSEVRF
ncbi:MAG: His/Gly/Thr/Pro-type tRNA ligase C-terminal domain-containing protein, partial [Helicobacter sp.]|nr:His/Gly/Thr/Pro-type tRNA ligase C-terminal domain-containing protein [Helicobacter sp.]MDY5740090.1 His/Gly/Thr/Pro-type tRNA ligase C-terminal domain-containing protein [Helicobacter sp.]